MEGNSEADALAETGRLRHPNNEQSLPNRRRVEPMWEELGLEEMSEGASGSPSDCSGSSGTGLQMDDVSESSSSVADASSFAGESSGGEDYWGWGVVSRGGN